MIQPRFGKGEIVMVQVGLGEKVRARVKGVVNRDGESRYTVGKMPDGPTGTFSSLDVSAPIRARKASAKDYAMRPGHVYILTVPYGVLELRYEGKDRFHIWGILEFFHPARRWKVTKPKRGQRVRVGKSAILFLYEQFKTQPQNNTLKFPEENHGRT